MKDKIDRECQPNLGENHLLFVKQFNNWASYTLLAAKRLRTHKQKRIYWKDCKTVREPHGIQDNVEQPDRGSDSPRTQPWRFGDRLSRFCHNQNSTQDSQSLLLHFQERDSLPSDQ